MPARGPRIGGRLGHRGRRHDPVVPVAQHPRCARRPRHDHGRQRLDQRATAGHHPRCRRRLRGQDHVLPRGGPPRHAVQASRSSTALAREPDRVDDGPWSRTWPDPVRDDGRQPRRQGHPLPTSRHPGLRRMGRDRHHPGSVHDPADVVGGLRHPQHRVPDHERRHQHDTDHCVPRRRATRGDRGRRAVDGHVRRRARHGSRRGASPEPDPQVLRTPHDRHRSDL